MRTILVLILFLFVQPAQAYDRQTVEHKINAYEDELNDVGYNVCTRTRPKKLVTCHYRFKMLRRQLYYLHIFAARKQRTCGTTDSDKDCIEHFKKQEQVFFFAVDGQLKLLIEIYGKRYGRESARLR